MEISPSELGSCQVDRTRPCRRTDTMYTWLKLTNYFLLLLHRVCVFVWCFFSLYQQAVSQGMLDCLCKRFKTLVSKTENRTHEGLVAKLRKCFQNIAANKCTGREENAGGNREERYVIMTCVNVKMQVWREVCERAFFRLSVNLLWRQQNITQYARFSKNFCIYYCFVLLKFQFQRTKMSIQSQAFWMFILFKQIISQCIKYGDNLQPILNSTTDIPRGNKADMTERSEKRIERNIWVKS